MRCHCLLLGAVLLLGAIDVTSSFNVWELSRANGDFAFRLYSKLTKGAVWKNVFFSPLSISTALSMTYGGARDKTAYEMCMVLGFSPLPGNVHATYEALLRSLNNPQAMYELLLANGVFVNDKFTICPSYANLLTRCYSAGFKSLDFNKKATDSAKYINQWVEDRTNGKITDLVSAGQVQGAPLVLVNTIYFKGDWQCQFRRTEQAYFHLTTKKTKLVKMMMQTARFGYAVNHHLRCQILELPYDGCRVSMYILLPKATEGLAALERKLTFNSVTAALDNLRNCRLSVGIPKFEISAELDLPAVLGAMGMSRAFTPAAEFGGISSARPLFVKKVIHKAFINVNETGTEAAAATAVVFFLSTPHASAQFLADHPFLFLIRDKVTGSILFLGRYVQ